MSALRAFSLIELLACMAIVAIATAWAVPAYQAHLQRVRRLDAQQALLDVQLRQQRFLFDHGRYATQLAELVTGAGSGVDGARSPEGHYRLHLTAGTESWRATAIPASDGPQRGDAACTTLSLDDEGRRDATGAADARVRCWR